MARTRRPERPFTIGDAMILVAALAAGSAWAAEVWRGTTPAFRESILGMDLVDRVVILLGYLLPILGLLTAACLILRLRGPRPAWRRAARQPGASACLAVLLTFLIVSPAEIAWVARSWGPAPPTGLDLMSGLLEHMAFAAPVAGIPVLVTWLLQAIQGRWRADPGWLDRMGRVVGGLWILFGAVFGVILLMLAF